MNEIRDTRQLEVFSKAGNKNIFNWAIYSYKQMCKSNYLFVYTFYTLFADAFQIKWKLNKNQAFKFFYLSPLVNTKCTKYLSKNFQDICWTQLIKKIL